MNNKEGLRNRCIKIIGKIKPSFPSLEKVTIHVHLWRQPQGAMTSVRLFGYRIFVDYKKMGRASDAELTGALAHEMVHLEHNRITPYAKLLIEFVLYCTSSKFRRKLERETDRIVVEKGYGPELLKRRESRFRTDRNAQTFIKKYYLLPEEIKSLIKQKK